MAQLVNELKLHWEKLKAIEKTAKKEDIKRRLEELNEAIKAKGDSKIKRRKRTPP